MAWIELHQGLREHKKMFACAEALNLSRIETIGTLVSLWLWALDNAQDGSLQGISNRTVACVCGWPEKKADKLVNTLKDTGWLDYDDDKECLVIHDWYDYAGKLMEQREKDRERKRKEKSGRKNSGGIPAENPRNNQGIPGATITVPLPYPNHISGDAVDGSAGARDADENELAEIGLKPGEYLGVTVGQVEEAKRIAQDLIARYAPHRCCTTADCRMVFWRFHRGDADAVGLLEYAFEAATLSGNAGNWRYINGILDRCALRDIRTAQAAREWDMERPDLESGSVENAV